MSYYIGIQDLAANALIELLMKNKGNQVSLNSLYDYGVAVVELLNAEEAEGAYLMLSRDRTIGFMEECQDIVEVLGFGTKDAKVALKDGVTVEALIERFCGTIPIPVLRAMGADGPVGILLKAA